MAVAPGRSWLVDTAQAFDLVAGEYDRTNRENPILAHMRRTTIDAVRRHVPPGAALLDLGCGPGTDHPTLTRDGYRVTGIDASARMVAEARRRADEGPGLPRPDIHWQSVDELDRFPAASFDAAFSNFGPLNCVPDLGEVARGLHAVVRPGGVMVASVIGRVCPWETALYLARGQVGRAFLRFRRGLVPVPLREGTIWMRYLTPREFARPFLEVGFTRCNLFGMGVVAPPPYLEHLATRYPRVTAALLAADRRVGGLPLCRSMGDHFVIVLRRG
ncbi:MAG: class I SAM-dependent methyltransferase [Vicinamibacterales bacterium]